MDHQTTHRFQFAVAAVATSMVICATVFSGGSGASKTAHRAITPSAANRNVILFKRGFVDTEARKDLDTSIEDRRVVTEISSSTPKQTRIVQFNGPIQSQWLDALRTTGAEIIGYVPNNAYIIRGGHREVALLAALDGGSESDDARPIRWMSRLLPTQKIDPVYSEETLASDAGPPADVEIELIDSPDAAWAIDRINSAAIAVNRPPRRFLKYAVLSVTVRTNQLPEIAALDDVLYLSAASAPRLADERGTQIVAGNLVADGTQPIGPGYAAWLASKGMDSATAWIVDIGDSGMDIGSTSFVHPDFLDGAGNSRVKYNVNYAGGARIDDHGGHGTIVASIIGGIGSPDWRDTSGYRYGLGVDPGAKLGASRIFDERGVLPSSVNFTTVVSGAYAAGARISNNSWGNSSNDYDSTAQQYDALVRDAQPSVPGNQEMVIAFAAGNFGNARVGSPGTAKNVITVGASENYRPDGLDSCNADGAGGVGPEGADNALDILRYSSGGPVDDGRAKPDIAAPGTHVFGAASQSNSFIGDGLCPGVPVFRPPGQYLYTWSSGTSLAAPHISGAASLLRKYFISRNILGDSRPPSPAMTKAFLTNSASYMTGNNAGGDLPGETQGWGLVNLSRAFDNASRTVVDQAKLFTASGQTYEIQGSLADRSRPLRVTLAWTDAPGSLIGAAIVNDLDLEVSVGGVVVYRGNNFSGGYSVAGGSADRLNNVESIYLPSESIPPGFQGNFKITVHAANIAGDGVPGNASSVDQDFALVVYNVAPPLTEPPPPPKIPVIAGVIWVKKTITISGHDFTSAAQVEINGRLIDRVFDFDLASSSLSLRWKPGKLNLSEGNNQIVLIENGQRSLPFVLLL